MSHMYFYTDDNTANGKPVESVALSNTSHANWQAKANLSRQMRNTVTGEVITTVFHTTMWDAEPLYLSLDDFSAHLARAQEAYGEDVPPHMQSLYDLLATAQCDCDRSGGEEPRIYIF